jgi:hypothetical protein
MSEQPKHPPAEHLPAPDGRHGGEHGIPPGLTEETPTGFPTDDRHESEVTPAKDHAKPG